MEVGDPEYPDWRHLRMSAVGLPEVPRLMSCLKEEKVEVGNYPPTHGTTDVVLIG